MTGRRELPGAGERGVALVLTLMVLLTLTGLALAFLSVSAFEPRIARNLSDAARARYLAEAGIEVGYNTLVAATGEHKTWSPLLATVTAAGTAVEEPGLERQPTTPTLMRISNQNVSCRKRTYEILPFITAVGCSF